MDYDFCNMKTFCLFPRKINAHYSVFSHGSNETRFPVTGPYRDACSDLSGLASSASLKQKHVHRQLWKLELFKTGKETWLNSWYHAISFCSLRLRSPKTTKGKKIFNIPLSVTINCRHFRYFLSVWREFTNAKKTRNDGTMIVVDRNK